MLSKLALSEKRASDSEILEFIPLTACGVRKIDILIFTSTACTKDKISPLLIIKPIIALTDNNGQFFSTEDRLNFSSSLRYH